MGFLNQATAHGFCPQTPASPNESALRLVRCNPLESAGILPRTGDIVETRGGSYRAASLRTGAMFNDSPIAAQ